MLNCLCASRFILGWARDAFYFAHHMLMHFHAYVPYIQYIFVYLNCLLLFWLSLSSPSLSLSFTLMRQWHRNVNLLRPKTLFVPRHLPLILLHPISGSVMIKAVRTFWRTFPDKAFIWNTKSSYQIFPILAFSLSYTVGVRSHCVASRLLVFPWSYMSFTPTAWFWLFYTSFCYSRSRYAHCNHSGSYIRGATRTEGSASWLPKLRSS